MTNNDLIKMIDEYFDGELKNGEETVLFISLSKNEKARNYFKRQHILKNATQELKEEFPSDLDKRILSKIMKEEKQGIKQKFLSPVFTYPAMLILLALSLFFYNQTNTYKKDIVKINNNIEQQNKTIESILNALPAAEVSGIKQDTIIVKATRL